MGVVFRAWRFYPKTDPRSEGGPRPVALKALRAQRAHDERVQAYFAREADALRALSHPNVVQFDELFEHAGSAVLAMEFIDGEPLDAVLKRHRARAVPPVPCMPALRALAYFEQLLGALAGLHALQIVHRDVKPQNILIRRDGIVKLTDFGIAKHALGDVSHRMATESGVAPGTGAYMSPEQVTASPIDGRSDLYSAATVLYEMLAGTTPFGGRGKMEMEVRHAQVNTRPPSVRSHFAHLPPLLDVFFERALAKDPAARFGGAIEMGNAVRAAFAMPPSEGWGALAEMADNAHEPDTDRMGSLRDIVVERYCTAPMPTRQR